MNIQRLLLIGAVLLGMAVPAVAQIGFQVSFGGRHHGRSLQISIGSRHHNDHHNGWNQRSRRHRGRRDRHVDLGLRYVGLGFRHGGLGFRYVNERVWVPGLQRRVYVPARYGYRQDACGLRVRYCIVPAHYEIVQDPGRWEYRRRRVWVGH